MTATKLRTPGEIHTVQAELLHLRKPYARNTACGITGSVQITEVLSEATCPRCRHDGDPVPRTRALTVEAAHAEALTVAQSSPHTLAKVAKLRTPEQSHTATFGDADRAVSISAQLTVDGGITLTVWSGPSRHNAVTFTYPDKALARRRYAQIRQLALTGATADQIDAHVHGDGNTALEQVRQILTDATEAVTATSSPRRTFVESIPGARVANCHRLAGTVKTSDPMDQILLAAAIGDGHVTRGRGCTSVQILALARRGLLEPVYGHGPRGRRLTGGRITEAGRRKLAAEAVA